MGLLINALSCKSGSSSIGLPMSLPARVEAAEDCECFHFLKGNSMKKNAHAPTCCKEAAAKECHCLYLPAYDMTTDAFTAVFSK